MTFYPAGDLAPVQVRIYQAHLEQRALAQGLSERMERRQPSTPAPEPTPRPQERPQQGPHHSLRARIWRRVYWL